MIRKALLYELANIINCKVIGDSKIEINGLNLCNRKSEYQSILTYVENDRYIEAVNNNISISCIIIRKADLDTYITNINRENIAYLISNNPEIDFYTIHNYLLQKKDFYEDNNFAPKVGNDCIIHPTVVIDNGTIIGDYVTIGANTVIKRGTIIGDNAIIGCNTVIGSEGFQIIKNKGVPIHISHLGKTHISDNVYIGDNTDICNSLFEGETFIGDNSKIDNLVHVAHNCYVGKNVVLTAGTILCGSSIVQEGAWIGINSSILNKVIIGENATVGIGSVVTRDVPSGVLVYGVPAKSKS